MKTRCLRFIHLLAALSALLVLQTFLVVPDAAAQVARAFTARYSNNANGDIRLIGNTVMTCSTTTGANAASCLAARTGGNATLNNNADFDMIYENVDSDPTRFNSSQATLSIPAGSTVLFAGLYWGASSVSTIGRKQVLLRTPATGGYSVVTASALDANGSNYAGFANITSQVAAGGNGTYTVANVRADTGNAATGNYGGWSIVVAYQNLADSLKNLTVYDGYATIAAGNNITVTPSGFMTPLSGPVAARVGSVVYDGDFGPAGIYINEQFTVNGTQLSNAANPANNYFNSTISDLGVLITARNPATSNTFGVDVDRTNVPSGLIPNGATSATVVMTSPTGGETYHANVLTTAIELYVPIITPNVVKTVTDVNGGNLAPGDVMRWTISLSNTGLDTGTNVVLKDPIPANTTYVSGSLRVLTGANSTPSQVKTDVAGDDQAEFSSSAVACAPVSAPCVIFRLGTDADAVNGGKIIFTDSTSLSFDTTVNAGVTSGTQISNTASISYSGQTLGATFSTTSAAATATVLAPPTISKSFSVNPIAINGSTLLSIVVSSPAASPANMTGVTFGDTYPAGMVNTATPAAAISCTPGSTPGTLTGGAAGGNSIGMNPGATLAPGGSCTITVNVTSAVAGNYPNTTSAVASANAGAGGTASATLAVGKPGITKAFSPASIISGGTSTVTITLTNPTAVALSAVAFSDALVNMQVAATPAILNTCGGTVSAAAGGAAISLANGALAASPAAGATCTISVNVTSTTTGVLPNTTSGVTSTESGAAGLPSNTANLTVIGAPVAVKSFSPTSIQTTGVTPGATSTLTITVTNPNTTTTITGVTFNDSYPQNVGGNAAADLLNATTPNATLNCTAGSSATFTGGTAGGAAIGISSGTLAPGGSCTVTVQVSSATTANYPNNTGTITTANAGNGAAASATLNVTNLAPPTVTKSFAVANMVVGGATTMTIALANSNGAANPITGVAFTDTYPAGLFNTASPVVSNNCGGTLTAPPNGASLALTGGTIPSTGCSVVINVTSSTPGPMLNSLPAGGVTTANAAVNTAATSATLRALTPPTITKSFSPNAIGTDAGDFSTMTIVVSNPGANGINLTGINFSDPYPQNVGGNAAADMVNAPTPTPTNTCTAGSTVGTLSGNAAGNATLGLTGATIPAGGSCTITIRVRGNAAATYVNTTGAVAATGPIALTGNTASATLSVGRPGITKSFAPSPILAGGTSVLTITLTNGTSVAMTSAAFTDTYPLTITNTSSPSAATTCGGAATAAANGPNVALSGGTIPANGSCTVTVNVTATLTSVNTIAVGALSTSAGTSATAASATLVVTPPLTVTKSFSPSSIAVNGTSLLTITLTNPNSFAVTGAGFTDTYPTSPGAMKNTNALTGATTCTAGTVTAAANGASLAFAGGSVPANSSCTITVSITAPTSGDHLNSTGAVITTNAGTATAASATLSVLPPPTVVKLVTVVSDPVNGTTNPKAIPGAIVEYSLIVTNFTVALTADTVVISDILNSNTALVVTDIAGAGSGPVSFQQGTASSGLTYAYTNAASATDDLEFFNSGGTRITTLTPNASGCDASIARIQVSPKGVFASGASPPQPSFVLRFRACIK